MNLHTGSGRSIAIILLVLILLGVVAFFVQKQFVSQEPMQPIEESEYTEIADAQADVYDLVAVGMYNEAIDSITEMRKKNLTKGQETELTTDLAGVYYLAGDRAKSASLYAEIIADADVARDQKVGVISEIFDYYLVGSDKEFLTQYIFTQEPFNKFYIEAQEEFKRNTKKNTSDVAVIELAIQDIFVYANSLAPNAFIQTRLARLYYLNSQNDIATSSRTTGKAKAGAMQKIAEASIASTSLMNYPDEKKIGLYTLNGVTRYFLGDVSESEAMFMKAMELASSTRMSEQRIYDIDLITRYQYALLLSNNDVGEEKRLSIENILLPFIEVPEKYKNVQWNVYYYIQRAAVLNESNQFKYNALRNLHNVSPTFKLMMSNKKITLE